MQNEIRVPRGQMQHLGRIFGKSQPFIRKVLRGERNSDIARKIRFTALEHFGGVEIQVVNNSKKGAV